MNFYIIDKISCENAEFLKNEKFSFIIYFNPMCTAVAVFFWARKFYVKTECSFVVIYSM